MTVKTKFVGKNPFEKQFEVSDLVICKDPIPSSRVYTKYKYDPIFSKMKKGEALKCPGDRVDSVAAALRSFIKRNNMKAIAKATPFYSEQLPTGRVWLL